MHQNQKGTVTFARRYAPFELTCFKSRVLEQFFRMYLFDLLDQCPFPLEIVYTPAKCLGLHPMARRSPIKTYTSAPPASLMIQPLTPEFYTNILKYSDALTALEAESESLPQVSDPISQRVFVSNMSIAQKLVVLDSKFSDLNTEKCLQPCSESTHAYGWNATTAPSGQSFMEHFANTKCSQTMRVTYRVAYIHFYLTKKLAWGSYRLMSIYGLFFRAISMRLISKGLIRYLQCNSTPGGDKNVILMLGIWYLLARVRRGVLGKYYS